MAITWRFSYKGETSGGVEFVNDFHYVTQVGVGGDETPASEVLSLIDTKLRTAYRGCIPIGGTVVSAELREEVLRGSGSVPQATTLVVQQAGTLATADNKLPYPMCAIIKKRTNAALRSGRGYVAMPSPESSSYLASNRKWTGQFLTNLGTLAALLDDDMEDGQTNPTSIVPVVYSRQRHNSGITPYTFQIEEGVVRDIPSWRRSRMTAP